MLRDRHCVFPGCTTDARACDLDHLDPYVPTRPGRTTRPDQPREPGLPVQTTSPDEDLRRLGLPTTPRRPTDETTADHLRVDEPAAPHLPRHHPTPLSPRNDVGSRTPAQTSDRASVRGRSSSAARRPGRPPQPRQASAEPLRLGQQLVHRARPEPVPVQLRLLEAGGAHGVEDRRAGVAPRRRRSASTSRLARSPTSRTRTSRTSIPACPAPPAPRPPPAPPAPAGTG